MSALPLFVYEEKYSGVLGYDDEFITNRADKDLLLIQNAFAGRLVTSKIFPLIWMNEEAQGGGDATVHDQEEGRRRPPSHRTIGFLQRVTPEELEDLAQEEKDMVGISLRDLVYAHNRGFLNDIEDDNSRDILAVVAEKAIQNATHAMNPSTDVYDLGYRIRVTPWPTPTHKVMRWIEAGALLLSQEGDKTDDDHDYMGKELFIVSEEDLVMVFCNIEDLCYHSMEHVVNLENIFDVDAPHLEMENWRQHHPGAIDDNNGIFTFQVKDNAASLQIFAPIQQWTCFAPPFNADQRGGQRLIFRSAILADRLTEMLQSECQNIATTRFCFVNHVFRLNKFEPTDEIFQSHYDLPYCDSINGHRSKFTLLLYLTEGCAVDEKPALRVGDFAFPGFKGLQGVVFHHSLLHEGRPFEDSTKLFLRSELVFESPETVDDDDFDSEVARMFNIACYASVFQQDIQSYATELFNHSVASRYNALAKPTKYKLFFRQVDGIQYITNGHDYWFLFTVELKVAVIVALLDYFNGTYRLHRFRNYLEEFEVLDDIAHNDNEIMKYLWETPITGTGHDVLDEIGYECFQKLPIPTRCDCPELCMCGSQMCTCPLIRDRGGVEEFNELASAVREEIGDFSFTIFDGSVRLSLEDIEVTQSDIRFRTTGYQERVFYAACAMGYQCERLYPVVEEVVDARLFHIPPVKYRELEELFGYHLVVDMFQNGWTERTLKVPVFGLDEEVSSADIDSEFTYIRRMAEYAQIFTERDRAGVPKTKDEEETK